MNARKFESGPYWYVLGQGFVCRQPDHACGHIWVESGTGSGRFKAYPWDYSELPKRFDDPHAAGRYLGKCKQVGSNGRA